RVLQAIGEILADEYFVALNRDRDEAQRITPEDRILKPQQIKQLYTEGVGTWAEYQEDLQKPTSQRRVYIITGWHGRLEANVTCFVEDNNMAIAKAMAMLNVPASVTRPTVNDNNMTSRFVRHEHGTTLFNNTGTHFTLIDRQKNTHWDPDPTTENVLRRVNIICRRFNTNIN
ncbi:MAG: hypothetical protein FWE37_04590, partial [Spirochaetaceae bacterium]|nr:hypothetical protein [Spirochaetaceae bacterium]